jgi:phosphoribosylamine--glycine ligase
VRVLVVGGGGREHALSWSLARSAEVFCAPGNPGTAEVATNLDIPVSDHEKLLDAIGSHGIDLTVVGPEAPLAEGLADRIENAGHRVFGPSAAAAQIESSKAFAKQLLSDAEVPAARSTTFTASETAVSYINSHTEPLVVKASGLAAGKGAIVCATRGEAVAAAEAMFGGKFGDAGREVLVEEFLEGEELSVLALTDGESVMMLAPSQDHKRIGEGDTGPNTGGMGAYAPVSLVTPALLERIEQEILLPTLRALAERGSRYKGVLYAGLMISAEGDPSVIEYNCRFGDPEAQVVLPLCACDLLDHMWRIAGAESWAPDPAAVSANSAAVTTILAASGYPEAPVKGAAITLPQSISDDTLLFHAGTRRDRDGTLLVAGGRVLCATGFGPTVAVAAEASRRLADQVMFDGKTMRRDIAWREIARAGAT